MKQVRFKPAVLADGQSVHSMVAMETESRLSYARNRCLYSLQMTKSSGHQDFTPDPAGEVTAFPRPPNWCGGVITPLPARVVVAVSTSRSRDGLRYVSTSRLGLVSTKIFNVSVSSRSRPLTSRARDLFSTKFCRSQY